jgi:hypothetical protein
MTTANTMLVSARFEVICPRRLSSLYVDGPQYLGSKGFTATGSVSSLMVLFDCQLPSQVVLQAGCIVHVSGPILAVAHEALFDLFTGQLIWSDLRLVVTPQLAPRTDVQHFSNPFVPRV